MGVSRRGGHGWLIGRVACRACYVRLLRARVLSSTWEVTCHRNGLRQDS